jgi:hypothetical protein
MAKLNDWPAEKASEKKFSAPVSVMETLDPRSPVTPPNDDGFPKALPPEKFTLLIVTELFPSERPLPSVTAKNRENGPAGWPTRDDVLIFTL